MEAVGPTSSAHTFDMHSDTIRGALAGLDIGPYATLGIRPHEARHGEWMPDATVKTR
jgi:hypothetical protein